MVGAKRVKEHGVVGAAGPDEIGGPGTEHQIAEAERGRIERPNPHAIARDGDAGSLTLLDGEPVLEGTGWHVEGNSTHQVLIGRHRGRSHKVPGSIQRGYD